MFCCENLESVHGGDKVCVLDSKKSCELEWCIIPSLLRASVDVCSIKHVLLHMSKCLDVWKSSKDFYLDTLL